MDDAPIRERSNITLAFDLRAGAWLHSPCVWIERRERIERRREQTNSSLTQTASIHAHCCCCFTDNAFYDISLGRSFLLERERREIDR